MRSYGDDPEPLPPRGELVFDLGVRQQWGGGWASVMGEWGSQSKVETDPRWEAECLPEKTGGKASENSRSSNSVAHVVPTMFLKNYLFLTF